MLVDLRYDSRANECNGNHGMKMVKWSSGVQGRQWLRVLVSVFSKEAAQEKGREDTLSSRFLPKSKQPLDLFRDSCVMSCARGVQKM